MANREYFTTIALTPELKNRLASIKYAKGFKTYTEVIQYLLDVVENKSTVNVQEYLKAKVHQTCQSLGPEASFYLKFLVRRYPNMPKEVIEFIDRNNEEIKCGQVLGGGDG